MTNQNATTERTNLQTKRCSKDEAAALRKNHVSRPYALRVRVSRRVTDQDGQQIRAGIRFGVETLKTRPQTTFGVVDQPIGAVSVDAVGFVGETARQTVRVGIDAARIEQVGKSVEREFCHTLGRPTEGFYDTALNEANDA